MKVSRLICKKKHFRKGPSLLRENQKLVPLDRHLSQLYRAWNQVKPHEREQCLLEVLKLKNDDGTDDAAVMANYYTNSAVAAEKAKQKKSSESGPTATKLTGGVCEPVSYWSAHGTTNASYRWRHFFNKVYYENHLDTAPTFTCPFCLQRAFDKRTKQNQQHQQQQQQQQPTTNEAMQHLTDEIQFLRECMTMDGALPKYSPTEIQRHAAWLHPQQGWEQTSLQVHNRFMLAHLKHRLRHHHLVELEYLREVQEHKSAEGEKEKQGKEANLVRHHLPPFKLILLLDVANLELGGDALLSVLEDRDAQHTFSTFPIAICAMHELFIPHTSRVLHAAFQLAQLHPHSEFYNFYSCTRAEAGDILTAWLAAALREGRQPLAYYDDLDGSDADRNRVQISSSHDPPIVLLTKDSQQRMCMTEVFGAGTPTAAPGGTLRATRQVQLAAIMHVIKEALQASWSPPY